MADDATISFGGDISGLEDTLGEINSQMKGWATATKTLVAGALAFISVDAIISASTVLVGLASEQEDAEQKLASVLKATGNQTGFTAEQMKEYASALQETTRFGDEATISAQATLATFKSINGNNFLQATSLAQDLATVLDEELAGSAKKLGQALNEPSKGLAALADAGVVFTKQETEAIIALEEFGDIATAQQIILERLSESIGGAAAGAAGTFSGKVESLTNTLGDFGEVIGGVLMEALGALWPSIEFGVELIGKLVDMFADWSTGATDYVEGAGESILSWFTYFVDGVIEAYTWGETFFENLGLAAEIWATTSLLNLLNVFGTIGHFFTEAAPKYLGWLYDNWTGIFVDIAEFTGTVVTNMYDNLFMFWLNVFDLLQGGSFNFEWKGLTEGFESSLDELPKIAERKLSPFEQSLTDNLNVKVGEFLGAFDENLKTNRAALGLPNPGDPVKEDDTAAKAISAEGKKSGEEIADAIGEALDFASEKEAKDKAATGFESLDEMLSRIQDSAAGNEEAKRSADGIEKLITIGEKQLAKEDKPGAKGMVLS